MRVLIGKLTWRQLRLLASSFILLLSCCNFYQHQAHHHDHHQAHHQRRLSETRNSAATQPTKILFVMTSIHEFDNGKRNTQRGYDRFLHTLLPVARESIHSLVDAGHQVDFYLIAHYTVSTVRRQQLHDSMPHGTGLQVWDDATPLGYAVERDSRLGLQNITRALARQHRYVIKDKFEEYDFFVNFEDDMLVRAAHVEQFRWITNELYRLRQSAAADQQQQQRARSTRTSKASKQALIDRSMQSFWGNLTVQQLQRMLPGFIRVETALPGFAPKEVDQYQHIPRNFQWNETATTGTTASTTASTSTIITAASTSGLDAAPCCHVAPTTAAAASDHLPPTAPTADALYFWETSIDVLGVRQMPHESGLGWVLLQAGNEESVFRDARYVIGDYWSGRDGYYGDEPRPPRTKGRYLNNQGGWMATRRQIHEWHVARCPDGFLPPYNGKGRRKVPDGMGAESVEYWSGGIQIAGIGGCNLQRILTLDPTGFSKQLLYHTSNNKQRQSNVQHRFSSRSINHFWGQLNTIRKNAEHIMQKEIEETLKS